MPEEGIIPITITAPSWRRPIGAIRFYVAFRLQTLRNAILEAIGATARLRQLQNALEIERRQRELRDEKMLELINRHANQVNVIAKTLPAIVGARQRLEFHEQHCLPLTNSYARFKREAKEAAVRRRSLTLEIPTNGQRANDDHASGAGAGREVPEGAGSHAPGEDGEARVPRANDDGREEGRGEVQADTSAIGLALHTVVCGECRERYDPRQLDQLLFHEGGHQLREATGIVGMKIE